MSMFEQGFRAELQKLAFNLTQARKVKRIAKAKKAKGLAAFFQGLAEGPSATPADPIANARSKIEEMKKHLGIFDRVMLDREFRDLESQLPRLFKEQPGRIVMPPEAAYRAMLKGFYGEKMPKLTKAEKELLGAEAWAHELAEARPRKQHYPAFASVYQHMSPSVILEESARMATLPKEYSGVRSLYDVIREPEHELIQKATGGRIGYGFRPTRHARKHLKRMMEEQASSQMPEFIQKMVEEGAL